MSTRYPSKWSANDQMNDAPGSSDGNPDEDADDATDAPAADVIPDESTLLGKVGVEAEVLAELARAEGEMNDPDATDDPDAAGAQV
jgi:hypothetical protein